MFVQQFIVCTKSDWGAEVLTFNITFQWHSLAVCTFWPTSTVIVQSINEHQLWLEDQMHEVCELQMAITPLPLF